MSKEEKSGELETLDLDLEIADLEYDVGGVGAVEATDSQVNYASNLIIYAVCPK